MINVNTVYQTVLLILNKEQRGYMTPDEFNKMGEQVQLEIFEKYFEDLNQLIRSPQTDSDYADRVTYLEEKISEFETVNAAQFVSGGTLTLPSNLHRLNTVAYSGIELQSLGRKEFYNIVRSPLTAPTETYPVYTQDNGYLRILPTTIKGGVIELAFLRTPVAPKWGFEVNQNLQFYVYKSTESTNFELHASEEHELVVKILSYAGIIIRAADITQVAAAKEQQIIQSER